MRLRKKVIFIAPPTIAADPRPAQAQALCRELVSPVAAVQTTLHSGHTGTGQYGNMICHLVARYVDCRLVPLELNDIFLFHQIEH